MASMVLAKIYWRALPMSLASPFERRRKSLTFIFFNTANDVKVEDDHIVGGGWLTITQ